MRRFTALASLFVLAVVAATPATAEHGDIHPTFRTERTYFHCQGDARVDNVAAAQGTVAGWDTTFPQGAFAGDGAGCGSVETPLRNQQGVEGLDTRFAGTFTGNLQAITVHLHELAHETDAVGTVGLIVRLEIEGLTVAEQTLRIPGQSENSGVTHAVDFSFTGIDIAVEDGNGQIQRDYLLEIRDTSTDSTPNFWAFDADEVPAGLTFNPKTPVPPSVPVG